MKYPPYACQHCGLANGDMFYDWFTHEYGKEPSDKDWDEFWLYKSTLNID